MAVSARRRNESSDDEDEDQSYSSNHLSFSLPAGDFERFMLVKHRGKYLERLPMQASFVSWNGLYFHSSFQYFQHDKRMSMMLPVSFSSVIVFSSNQI
jgi:hypothetical protein